MSWVLNVYQCRRGASVVTCELKVRNTWDLTHMESPVEGKREAYRQHTPKCWWSHSPSLPRKETRCLQCEENWTCALTFSPSCAFVRVSHWEANGSLLPFNWSDPRVIASSPQIHLHSSSTTFQQVCGDKREVQKTNGAFPSLYTEAPSVLDYFNFFLYVRQTRESPSSEPLQGEETAAVRAVSEFRSVTCFCFG